MNLYDFNIAAYKKIIELFKFRFYKQIKDTGIVFKEILEVNNLVTNKSYYILICFDQEKNHSIKFKHLKTLVLRLTEIAKIRIEDLVIKEKELLEINDIECYGEGKYFNNTEITAIGISSIKELLDHFDENKNMWNK